MNNQDYLLLIGTYGKKTSRHLYHCSFDGQIGRFSVAQKLSQAQQSSYLAQATSDRVLSLLKVGDKAGLALLSDQGQVLSQVLAEPVPACHLAYLPDKGLAYTANYHTGDIVAYRVCPTGQLQLTSRLALGPDSQPHFVGETTDGLIVVSLMGQDRLACYKSEDQHWEQIGQLDLPPGTRPRHLVFNPTQKIVYVLGEGDNQVHTLFYDGYGAFEHYQSLPTLPAGTSGDSWAGAIRLSPDSRFLYVTNRGQDSLTVFAVKADGGLVFVEWLPLPAKNPRDLILTPQGDWLLVACLDSNQVLSFAIDQKTGKLRAGDHIEVEEPVALLVQNP